MNYSLGETGRLSRRAAHGAGLCWGMSDEAATAVMCLHRFGLPGAQLLAELLTLNDSIDSCELAPMSLKGEWTASAGRLCPLAAGAALSDSAAELKKGESIRLVGITHPLLLVPFAAGAAMQIGQPVCLEWGGVCIVTDGQCLDITGSQDDLIVSCSSEVRCSLQGVQSADRKGLKLKPDHLRVEIEGSCCSTLSEFAQRTYAPATEDSRLRGAGTGTDDAD